MLPESEVMKKYNPKIQSIVQSPGNLSNVICVTLDTMQQKGIGLIDPSKILNFYKDYHSYLASCGVNGVKVDIQNVLELLGAGYGGRVSLTRQYLGALEDSVMETFNANNLICSMSLNTDFFYRFAKIFTQILVWLAKQKDIWFSNKLFGYFQCKEGCIC